MNSPISSENRLVSTRVTAFLIVLIVVFIYYAFRLFSLQIINGQQFVDQANDNRTDEISVPTNRGMIFDRNDYILARNTPSYNVIITPAFLPEDDGEIQEIFRELSTMIDVPAFGPEPDELTAKNFNECRGLNLAISQIVYIAGSLAPFNPVRVKCNIDKDTALSIEERRWEWPGVGIQVEPVREYPTGQLTAEVVGFLGPIPAGFEDQYPGFQPNRDKVGYAGIEQRLQEFLGGTPGKRVVEFDGLGKELRDLAVQVDPIPGSNVRLTIDTRLQLAAKAALEESIELLHSNSPHILESNGVVIAMNPQTGEILALVSYPTFENNRMAREIPEYYYRQLSLDPNRPLFNHAISAEHPPGSVFKMAAALGILNEGVVTPDFTIEDPGEISIEEKILGDVVGRRRRYVCHKTDGHGTVDYLTGIAESCDVYFYKVGGGFEGEVDDGGLGIWRLDEYSRALGYDLRTGIELPGEANGNIPDPDWKRLTYGENWSTGDTYIGTIGQGYVLATPLQVLRSIATIANNGVMMKPTLIKDILDPEGHVIQPFEPNEVCDISGECTLSCEVSTGRCTIDTLQLCDVNTGTCRLTTHL
jgi:penicillin-binding protein 2